MYSICADTSMSVRYSVYATALAIPICIYTGKYMPLLLLFTAGSAADIYASASACAEHKKTLDDYMLERRKADLLIQREVLRIAHADIFADFNHRSRGGSNGDGGSGSSGGATANLVDEKLE